MVDIKLLYGICYDLLFLFMFFFFLIVLNSYQLFSNSFLFWYLIQDPFFSFFAWKNAKHL